MTVFMALAMVFAFVLPAMADEICPPCEKCAPPTLTCPSGDQEGAHCSYSGDYYRVNGLNGGHLPDYGRVDGELALDNKCPVIFSICECDNPSQFHSGAVVGIRMTILVNGQEGDNGAYFADDYEGNVILSNSRDFLCDPECSSVVEAEDVEDPKNPLEGSAYYCDVNKDGQMAGEPIWREDQFSDGSFQYYRYSDGKYVLTSSPDEDCPPTKSSAKAVRIISSPTTGIKLTDFDETYNLSHWAIDIPQIYVTPAIQECSTISVEICLLIGDQGGICGECECVCSCVYDLYTTCCEEENYCLLFPFVPFTDTGWNAGIALSDVSAFTSSSSVDRTVTFMFVPKDGQVSTWTDSGIDAIKTYNFATDILPNLVPAPTSTVGELMLSTNFHVHGMLYLTNGVFGAAHLGACCCGPCGD
ncbi:MAG: hypothetical protein JRI51_04875 [Deltaproteobacteria bacterium]|nr:hypothetical protein [Deltaproteobacteria bacterium]